MQPRFTRSVEFQILEKKAWPIVRIRRYKFHRCQKKNFFFLPKKAWEARLRNIDPTNGPFHFTLGQISIFEKANPGVPFLHRQIQIARFVRIFLLDLLIFNRSIWICPPKKTVFPERIEPQNCEIDTENFFTIRK